MSLRAIVLVVAVGCVAAVLSAGEGLAAQMTGGRIGGSMMGNAWMGSAGMGGFGWTGILLVLVVGVVAALLILSNSGKKA